jgi:asparagine synthase (glutamine-hydrolysing)
VGLAHRRLAVIDLSPLGHQPMMDATGHLCLVFNGEIYNFTDLRRELEREGYSFRSAGDTEVILAAYRRWDVDCVRRFNGMFSFALYDTEKHRLLMARDRAGEKPLFYAKMEDKLVFSSELKALMIDPEFSRNIDPVSLDCYLAFSYIPGERCIFKGASKLPPAHALTFEPHSGRLKMWRYYRIPEVDSNREREETAKSASLTEELESLLEDSVKRQMVSDVPVGILLSGGMDSSLVTAMAARVCSRVKTFTIRFSGCGKYDETEHARLIARHFQTEHIELEAAMSQVDILPMLVRQFDEPMADSSMIPTFWVSQLIRKHCTVALGGDGGDELFGGYGHYNRMLWMQENFGWIPSAVGALAGALAGKILPPGFKGRAVLQGLGDDMRRGLPNITCFFDRVSRIRLLGKNSFETGQSTAEEIHGGHIPDSCDLLQRATRHDFENGLSDDILVKVDRASMLNSLEVRAPLLDYRIIDFAFGKVPSSLKATVRNRKILLKQLARRVLPPEFDHNRKQGFCIPLALWLRKNPWHSFFREVLLDSADSPFNRKFVAALLDSHIKGYANSERLFALAFFELWRKEYRVSV